MADLLNLKREELHKLVWQTPMSKLAKQYGLSDRGLAKICARMAIPVPGRGYWAKLYSGAKPHSKPLRKAAKDCQEVVRLHQPKEMPENDTDKKKDLFELQQVFAGLSASIAHKLVEATKKRLENAKPDDNGILVTQAKRCLDIRVSNDCMDRALSLLNKLFIVLEERGFSIEIKEEEKIISPLTCLKLDGEAVQIHIEEKLNSTPHILTDAEKKKLARKEFLYGRYSDYPNEWHMMSWEPPKWDYHPSGQLQFKIDNLQSSGLRQNWSDSADRKLESLLPTIAYYVIQSASYLRNRTLEREARDRRWAEEARKRAEYERQQLEEQKKVEHLDKLLAKWSKREEILQFLAWIDGNIADDESTDEFIQWYEWAKNYAQKLNPLAKKKFYKPEKPRYGYWDNGEED